MSLNEELVIGGGDMESSVSQCRSISDFATTDFQKIRIIVDDVEENFIDVLLEAEVILLLLLQSSTKLCRLKKLECFIVKRVHQTSYLFFG